MQPNVNSLVSTGPSIYIRFTNGDSDRFSFKSFEFLELDQLQIATSDNALVVCPLRNIQYFKVYNS